MRTIYLPQLLALHLFSLVFVTGAVADETGWRALFNGKDLSGWTNPYEWGEARIVDREIHLTANKKFFLVTEKTYDDFVFEGEVLLPEGKANSGFMFRCHVEKNRVYGYQAEVDGSERRWSAGLYDEGRRGWLWPSKKGRTKEPAALAHEERSQAHFKQDAIRDALKRNDWNRYRITCQGDSIRIELNGVLVTEYRDATDATGYLGIQHHGEQGQTYRFRNLRIRELRSNGGEAAHSFRKIRLTEEYFAEGASVGDFNRDGKRDVVCGPNWFAGPDFSAAQKFYDAGSFPNDRGYSNNFFSFVGDFNGDQWDDVLVVGLPGTPAHWYENSQGKGLWSKHFAFPAVDNEAPSWEDIDADGKPELICTFEGRLGYAEPNPEKPTARWEWTPISEKGPWQRFSHGLGLGDVDGDGAVDYLMPEGWWRNPQKAETIWEHRPIRLAAGGAQIYAMDVDGDGDADIVSSNQAHAWGLHWFEQTKPGEFEKHLIMGSKPEENPFGVAFSQLHALVCRDVDNDGRIDIVTGKCYWAHNGHDPGAKDPAVIYWFRNTVDAKGKVVFKPHLVDADSGVGRQIRVVDLNGDGRLDIVAGNKKGTFVFLHETQSAK